MKCLIGTRLLNHIEKRCSEIFPNVDDHFSDVYVYLFGNYRQLPPIMGPPVYSERFHNTIASQGALDINTFQASYELRTK